MKKIISLSLIVLGLLFLGVSSSYAQQRTKIADGYYVVNYGNVSVIEDDNRGMSIEIKVEKAEKNSYGEQLYNVLCENKTIKSVAIGGLSKAIQVALTSAGIPIPSWVTGPIVAYVYESVCNYYGDR